MNEDYEYRRGEYYEEDEIDLYELWLTIKKRKWIVITTTFLFVLVATIYAFFIAKPIYRSEAKILPLEEDNTGISSYKAIAGMLGISVGGGGKSEKLMAVLNSDTLKMKVIERLNLIPVLFSDIWDEKEKKWKVEDEEDIPDIRDALKELEDLINVSQDKKTGVINISVDYPENPELAKIIADTLLDEARKIINEKSFSLAHRYRVYLEKQLFLVKKKIDLLEEIYIRYIKGELKTIPYIFNMKEEEIEKFSIDDAVIKKTKTKLDRLEKNINKLSVANSLPEKRLNIERLNLQFSLLKNVFISLYREYEIAKLQEKKETLAFDVIDEPYIPKKPVKPKKKLILAVAGVSGLFLGVFLAFFIEWIENVKREHNRKDNSFNETE